MTCPGLLSWSGVIRYFEDSLLEIIDKGVGRAEESAGIAANRQESASECHRPWAWSGEGRDWRSEPRAEKLCGEHPLTRAETSLEGVG